MHRVAAQRASVCNLNWRLASLARTHNQAASHPVFFFRSAQDTGDTYKMYHGYDVIFVILLYYRTPGIQRSRDIFISYPSGRHLHEYEHLKYTRTRTSSAYTDSAL